MLSALEEEKTGACDGTVRLIWLCVGLLSLLLAGCGTREYTGGPDMPRGSKTYTVRGQTYRPYLTANGYREEGIASWYGPNFHGKKTSSGETYNMYDLTAAHKLLPLGTRLRVTHLRTGRSLIVRVNDRGPFVDDRIIDLSYNAARSLGVVGPGTARVRLEALGSVAGSRQGDLSGNFYIQVGAFQQESSARAMVQALRNRNLGGRTFFSDSLGLWRVQAGPFTSLTRAEDVADSLSGLYPGAFVVAD